MNGYGGKILRVNLSTGETRSEPTPEFLIRDFIGGRGFVSYYLFTEIPPGTEPFSEDNVVVVASGPLAGTTVAGGGKISFGTKSPATNSYGDSNMGGHLAGELKYAGYDAIIIKGKSEKPVYLFIENDKVELRDASIYWGKGCIQAETFLKIDLGERYQIATIGPGGENLVQYANLSHDFGRQAGRCGVGAVMGSKKLKAIAVRGTKPITMADPKPFVKEAKALLKECMEHPSLKEWQDYGTPIVTEWCNEIGGFPTRNFQSGYFESYKEIVAQKMRKKIVLNDKACFACPMCCGKYSHVKTTEQEFWVEGPEYETIALMGGNLGIGSIEQIAHLNYLCDEMGLDTISTGNSIGFVMECFEKKLLTKKQTDGLELKFGNYKAAAELIPKIARKQGFGEFISLGVKKMADKIGKGSEAFAMQVKGLEISGYESRFAPAMMLSYATCDVGGHHNRSWAITYDLEVGRDKYEGKAERVKELQHIRPMFDMLGVCRLQWVELGVDLEHYSRLFSSLTGINYSLTDIYKRSEAIWNLNRMFLLREKGKPGIQHDQPPKRWLTETIATGPTKDMKPDAKKFEALLQDYYKVRGWDSEGNPTPKKLKELGILELVEKYSAHLVKA